MATPPVELAPQPAPAAASEQPWPPPAQAWYAVGIFAIGLTFLFLDRGVLPLLVQPIKRDLGLSDTMVGLLMGPAFIFFYLVLGLPIARLVDSRSRRAIIAFSIGAWSLMTAATGLTRNFSIMLLCRVGVGVGEAGNGPATYSMMADLFPPARLARAISFMQFGFVAGNGLATILGGVIIAWLSARPIYHLPVLGEMHSWQLTFFVVGLPGLIVTILAMTMIEPARRGRLRAARDAAQAAASHRAIPVREVLHYMAQNRGAYASMFLGLAFQSIVTFGIMNWGPTFFVRTYGWTIPHYAYVSGALFLILWPIGLIPGSLLGEWLTRRGYHSAYLLVTALTATVFVPLAILLPLMPNGTSAMAVMGATYLVAGFGPGPQNAALQIITPNEMRGQVTALFLFIFNVFGTGLAPLIIGLVTNYVVGSEAKVGESIMLTAAVLGPISVALMWLGIRPYARSVARSASWS
ncbi:MAG: MFS transporter [Steroidobacteraceae bacterium]